MATADADVPGTLPPPMNAPATIAVRPPGYAGIAAAALVVAVLAGLIVYPHFAHGEPVVIPALTAMIFVGLSLALRAVLTARARRGGAQSIRVSAEALSIPATGSYARIVHVPLDELRSATVAGRGRNRRVVFDTGRRAASIPLRRFVEPDGPARLHEALRQRIAAFPDAAARWEEMQRRQAIADTLSAARPHGALLMVLLIAAAYAGQVWLLKPASGMDFINAGASTPILILAGEWFRVVTANLLHMNFGHAAGNAVFLLIAAISVERLAGRANLWLLFLASGIAAIAVSAAAILWGGHLLYSIGASGAVCGLYGALAVFVWRFRASLPAGLSLAPARLVLILINIALTSFLVAGVDLAGHGGGLVTGIALALLLSRGCADIRDLRRPGAIGYASLAALAAIWVAGLGAAFLHARDPAGRMADLDRLAAALLDAGNYGPSNQNEVAYGIALAPNSRPDLLDAGRELVARAIASQKRANPNAPVLAAFIDTLAALDYRRGESERAVVEDLPAALQSRENGEHFARFLDVDFRKHGLRRKAGDDDANTAGDGGATPSVTLGTGVLQIDVPAAFSDGGRLFALLHREGKLAGMLAFQIPPRFSGTAALPVPGDFSFPRTEAPAPLWIDGKTVVDLALIETDGCQCRTPHLGPYFYATDGAGDLPAAP